eukprot:4518848-Karenia_brevis.AAC.1
MKDNLYLSGGNLKLEQGDGRGQASSSYLQQVDAGSTCVDHCGGYQMNSFNQPQIMKAWVRKS